MLTVAKPYFESDDFRGDVILHAAVAQPGMRLEIVGSVRLGRTFQPGTRKQSHRVAPYLVPRVRRLT